MSRKHFEIGLRTSFFQFFGQCLVQEEQIGHRKSMKGAALVCQGQIGEILPLDLGKLGIFLILVLFLYPSLPKTGHSQPFRIYLLNTKFLHLQAPPPI